MSLSPLNLPMQQLSLLASFTPQQIADAAELVDEITGVEEKKAKAVEEKKAEVVQEKKKEPTVEELQRRLQEAMQATEDQKMVSDYLADGLEETQKKLKIATGEAYVFNAPAEEIKKFKDLEERFGLFADEARYFSKLTLDDIGMIRDRLLVRNPKKIGDIKKRKGIKCLEDFIKPIMRVADNAQSSVEYLRDAATCRFQERDINQKRTVQQNQQSFTKNLKQMQQKLGRAAETTLKRHNFLQPLGMQASLKQMVDDEAVEEEVDYT